MMMNVDSSPFSFGGPWIHIMNGDSVCVISCVFWWGGWGARTGVLHSLYPCQSFYLWIHRFRCAIGILDKF